MNSKLIIQSGRGSGRGLSPGAQREKTLAEVMEMFPECKHSIPASLSPGKCCIPRSAPTGSLMPLLCLPREPWHFSKGVQKRLLSSILFYFHHNLCASVEVQCKFVQEWCLPGFALPLQQNSCPAGARAAAFGEHLCACHVKSFVWTWGLICVSVPWNLI